MSVEVNELRDKLELSDSKYESELRTRENMQAQLRTMRIEKTNAIRQGEKMASKLASVEKGYLEVMKENETMKNEIIKNEKIIKELNENKKLIELEIRNLRPIKTRSEELEVIVIEYFTNNNMFKFIRWIIINQKKN